MAGPMPGIVFPNRAITVIRKTGLFVKTLYYINEARRREGSAGEECAAMDDHVISPIDRLMILALGAISSWLAVGGIVLGASKLLRHLV